MPGHTDTKVGYRVRVADAAEIDRTAWAALISALISSEAAGNQTRFATKVGVTPRTVSRWLESEVAVRPQSVTEVARALGRSPVELLVRVGYLSPNEAAEQGPGPLDPLVIRWLKVLADPNVPEETKHRLRERMRMDLEWLEEIESQRQRGREEAEPSQRAAE